jgi:hypothetical protein
MNKFIQAIIVTVMHYKPNSDLSRTGFIGCPLASHTNPRRGVGERLTAGYPVSPK